MSSISSKVLKKPSKSFSRRVDNRYAYRQTMEPSLQT